MARNYITSIVDFVNTSTVENPFIIAIKDTLSDLSFIYADFLCHFIKKGESVIFINLAQAFHHYSQIMLKSGINMKTLREQKKILSIDLISEMEKAIGSTDITKDNLENLYLILSDPSHSNCLKPIYESIHNNVEFIKKSSNNSFFIIFDEINALTNLGVTLKAIQYFLLSCYSLCTENSGTLLIGSTLDWNDIESIKQVNYFSHISDVKIFIEGLETGYSKDTQGKVSIEAKNKRKNSYTKRKMFFKVEDKGAKFLTDGL